MSVALYIDGDITCLQGKVVIGVVGTRKPGLEGMTVTRDICTDLSLAGAVVVSGGALGIDSAAHEATIIAGGKTVCVLGCGLGTYYLMENEALRRSIAKNGAVVSEYPPFTEASRITFPQRNRIISGMSHGVLVVEANERSGSLITAKAAMAQKRELFAVPGSALSSAYTGANRLISRGAKAVTGAREILESYITVYPERLNLDLIGTKKYAKEEKGEDMPEGLDRDMQKVYACLSDEPVHFDDIVATSGLDYTKATTAIISLEVSGLITETESKKYILK
jgi:DNA processing protein